MQVQAHSHVGTTIHFTEKVLASLPSATLVSEVRGTSQTTAKVVKVRSISQGMSKR